MTMKHGCWVRKIYKSWKCGRGKYYGRYTEVQSRTMEYIDEQIRTTKYNAENKHSDWGKNKLGRNGGM